MSKTKKARPVGRPRIYKNKKAREEARKRQSQRYQETVRQQRYEAYQTDPEYRKEVLAYQRERYRRLTGTTPKRFGKNWKKAGGYGGMRRVKVGSKWARRKVLFPHEMANLFEITGKAFRNWVSTGKFPSPKLRSECGSYCYTSKQAEAMAKAMFQTMKDKSSFRATDTDAITAVLVAFKSSQP